MYCKIGSIKLSSDFEIKVRKREYVIITIRNERDLEFLHRRFFLLKNHYLRCTIKHELLEYSGYMKVCEVSDVPILDFHVELSFEI